MTEKSQQHLTAHRNQFNSTLTGAGESSLVSTHKNVLDFLKTSAVVVDRRSKRRLHDLQKKRIFLASEIARARSEESLLVKQNLDVPVTRKSKNTPNTSVLKDAVDSLNSLFISYQDDDSDHENKEVGPKNLASSMQRIRKKRKLAAAHRLGGITAAVPQMDSEILSFRFDICLDGVYVGCYHAFFDLIVATTSAATTTTTQGECDYESKTHFSSSEAIESNLADSSPTPKLYLRLTQHTIPSAIPFLDLCKESLGGSLFVVGDLNDKGTWRINKFKDCIRCWAASTYRACCCWEHRKRSWKILRQLCERANIKDLMDDQSLRVTSLTTTASNAYDRISFDLSKHRHRSSEGVSGTAVDAWEIHLLYENWVSGLPTTVNVNGKSHQSIDPVHPEFAKNIRKAFLDSPVEQALQVVSAADANTILE